MNTLLKKLRKHAVRRAWLALDATLPDSMLIRRGPAHAPRIALTFDDGPDPMTEAYLDVLDQFEASATFFVNGNRAADYPELIQAIAERGHVLGVHGWSHKPFPELSNRDIADELLATAQVLPPTPRPMVRPPYGALDPRVALQCWRAGYSLVMWSVDSMDGFQRDASVLVESLGSQLLRAGDIVLLHEGQTWTLEALPYVLADLRSAGYQLVTVPELFDATV